MKGHLCLFLLVGLPRSSAPVIEHKLLLWVQLVSQMGHEYEK